jgi:PAS domain S-box-containing protein
MAAGPSSQRPDPEQLIVADRQGVIIGWGTGCVKVFGYGPDEALGRTVALIIPPVLQARHWRGFNHAVDVGQLKRPDSTLNVPAIHRGGAVLAVKGRLTVNRADDGTVDGVTLTLLGEGSRWAAMAWRALLAVLNAGAAVGRRVRHA